VSFILKTLFSLRSIDGEKTHDVCGARPHDRGERDCEPQARRGRSRVNPFLADSSSSLDRNASRLFSAVVTVNALQGLLLTISWRVP
jgi:hypothetical protein